MVANRWHRLARRGIGDRHRRSGPRAASKDQPDANGPSIVMKLALN